MAVHVGKVQLAGLAKKLAALDCAAGFDETVLLYPETEAWAAIISQLCNRLQGGCTLDKLVKQEGSNDGPPPSSTERTLQLLDALCIAATESQILGSGSVTERTAFLHYLTDIAIAARTSTRSERLKEAASKDLQLLVAGCKAAPSLVVGDVSLFKRFPEVHEAIQAASKPEKPISIRLQEAKAGIRQAEAELLELGGKQEPINAEHLRAACTALEHSIGAFVSGAAEFRSLYKQDIEPWTASANCPTGYGIGPLAEAVDSRYASFRQVLQACSVLKASYEHLEQRYEVSTADKGYMSQTVLQGPALARELQERAAALQRMHATGASAGWQLTKSL